MVEPQGPCPGDVVARARAAHGLVGGRPDSAVCLRVSSRRRAVARAQAWTPGSVRREAARAPSLRRVGLLDRFWRSGPGRARQLPVVRTAVLDDEVRWSQPFDWGLLVVHDHDADWEVPRGLSGGGVVATSSCLAIPVRHAQDLQVVDVDVDEEAPPTRAQVEVVLTTRSRDDVPDHVRPLRSPSGRLQVGDAHEHHVVQVPAGDLLVEVWLQPEEHAERVVIALHRLG